MSASPMSSCSAGSLTQSRSSVRRHAEHDGAVAVRRVGLEPLHELDPLGEGVLAFVVEAEAPEGDDGLPGVVEVGGVLRDLHAVDEHLPVVHDLVHGGGAEAGEVVHDGVGAAVEVGAGAAVREDGGELAAAGGAGNLADEALDERAVDAVVAHPLEVAGDGLGVEGAVDLGGLPVGELEGGGVALVGVELAHVRPEVELAAAGLEAVRAVPVVPAASAAVALGGVPALVAAHHLAGQGLRIDAAGGRAGVGLEDGIEVAGGRGGGGGADRGDGQARDERRGGES